jgi:hypothetical protein
MERITSKQIPRFDRPKEENLPDLEIPQTLAFTKCNPKSDVGPIPAFPRISPYELNVFPVGQKEQLTVSVGLPLFLTSFIGYHGNA